MLVGLACRSIAQTADTSAADIEAYISNNADVYLHMVLLPRSQLLDFTLIIYPL